MAVIWEYSLLSNSQVLTWVCHGFATYQEGSFLNPQINLRNAAEVCVWDKTIQNPFRVSKWRFRRQVVMVPFTQRHRRLHLIIIRCRKHQRWNQALWTHVCFSDERKFNLRFNDDRLRLCPRSKESLSDATASERNQHGGGSEMV